MRRVIEEQDIIDAVAVADVEATERKLNRKMRLDLTTRVLRELLEAAPEEGQEIPPLAGLAEAAEILESKKQYVGRLRRQGDLPAVQQLQSGPVFRRADVERYALTLQESRRAREVRRQERAEA